MSRRSLARISLVAAALASAFASALVGASTVPGPVPLAAAVLFSLAAALAVFRGFRNGGRTSLHMSVITAALVFSAVHLYGGYGGLLTPMLYLLLAWMAHPSVAGPALETGAILGLTEGILIATSGGVFSPGLLGRVSAGAVPLLSLPFFALVLEWMVEGGRSRSSGSAPGCTRNDEPAEPGGRGTLEIQAELVKTVASSTSMGRAIHAAASWLSEAGSDLTVTVGLLSSDSGSLDIYESLGPLAPGRVGMTFDLEGSVAGWTIRSCKSVSRNGLSNGGRPVTTLSRQDPSSSLCGSCSAAPLSMSDKCIGVILVESGAEDGTGSRVEWALEVSSGLLGLAIEKILLREQRRDLQNRDGITGLPRLSDFMDFVKRTSRDVYRFGRSVSLFVVGIDSIEDVNSTHGHRSGDRLLSACGARLAETAGSEASVTRFSGAKFAVCVPGMDSAAAEAFAESLVRSFDCFAVKCESGEVTPKITVGGAVTRSERRVDALCLEASRSMSRARSMSSRFLVSVLQASTAQGGTRQ